MLDNDTNNKDNTLLEPYPIEDDDGIDFAELITTLLASKWLIIIITLIALAIGTAKALLDSPIYKADAMLQVLEASQPMGALEPIEGLFDNKVPVQAEIEIIKSRMVLGEAVKSLNKEIFAQPKHFPIVGQAIARQYERKHKNKIAPPWLDYPEYAWGGEQIKVDTLTVPTSWIGKKLTLIAGEKGRFKVKDNKKDLVEGNVGEQINIPLDIDDGHLSIFVSVLKARPGTQFTLSKKPLESAIQQLQKSFTVAEKGKRTGILNFTQESTSPEMAMQTLNTIANIYVRMNVEQKSEEAQKTLAFLEKQLPIIKEQLENATDALNEYRLEKGSVDLSIETQSILKGIVELRTEITLLRQKRDELRQSFTASHPTVIAIDRQISRLQGQMNRNNLKIEELPETQQTILRLARDVKVNTELYTTLLNNLQTIKVAKAGTVGDVRIIDYAVLPTTPIKPKKKLIVAVSLILGLTIGIALAFIRKALSHGVEDPDIIEKQLNVPVYATVPHSERQRKISEQLKRKKQSTAILALEDKDDPAIESLRSLRTTLHFAFLEAKNNIIMITGPSPGVGKTFISTNLAFVLASSGKRILLIDGDLRKGYINKTLGLSRNNGLSELISGVITTEEAIQTLEQDQVDFIATGKIPPNPSELLLHQRFTDLLQNLGQHYDHIIIDSPPVLAVTDACIIGRMASATLMVIKSGVHPIRELQQSVKRLQQNEVDIKGVIFNDLIAESSGYGYGYGQYVYQYNYTQ